MTVCSLDDCGELMLAKGFCPTHYGRWRRHGNPRHVARRNGRTEVERFWDYVDRADGCWHWTGATSHEYGNFYVVRDGKACQVAAHRYSYELANGPILEGAVLDHLCRVKRCVRPDHLEPVTQQVNVLRGDVARALRENRCRQGHEYTPDNTYVNTRGARVCRICQRQSEARYRARRAKP